MPFGSRKEQRPADVIGSAVKVMRIATREEENECAAVASAPAVIEGSLDEA